MIKFCCFKPLDKCVALVTVAIGSLMQNIVRELSGMGPGTPSSSVISFNSHNPGRW